MGNTVCLAEKLKQGQILPTVTEVALHIPKGQLHLCDWNCPYDNVCYVWLFILTCNRFEHGVHGAVYTRKYACKKNKVPLKTHHLLILRKVFTKTAFNQLQPNTTQALGFYSIPTSIISHGWHSSSLTYRNNRLWWRFNPLPLLHSWLFPISLRFYSTLILTQPLIREPLVKDFIVFFSHSSYPTP